MKHARLDTMFKGWFVGDFEPTVLRSKECEVGVKVYRAGECEDIHHHRVATEVTLILSGKARMMGSTWTAGDIIVVEPNEATGFEAISDVTTVVVKMPSAPGDKYMGHLVTNEAER